MPAPLKSLLALILALCLSGAIGLLFGILPGYVFPTVGADAREGWGYKGEPPHFSMQFSIGFLLSATSILCAALARRKRRSGKAEPARQPSRRRR